MSVEPPRSEGPRNSGMILVLGLASLVLLAIVVIFGLLAFNLNLTGGGDDQLESPALTSSRFTVVSSTTSENGDTAVEVEFSVQNPGDSAVENVQVLVQCEDGGYVSAINPVPALQPGEATTLRMQLIGTGEPACDEPGISFSPLREND